jgi:RNA polymerase sigma-70 factor (ECF subfamily)
MSTLVGSEADDDCTGLSLRLVRRDRAAEEEFVRRFSGRLMAMAVTRTRDPEAAREIVDDVLMATITALRRGTVQDTQRLGAFVHGTAVNLINNHLRSRGRQPRGEPLTDELPGRDGAESQEREADLRLLRRCVLELPERDRDILTHILVNGLGPDEIARRLGMSAEAVRQRKSRALKQLKDILAGPSRSDVPRPQGRS